MTQARHAHPIAGRIDGLDILGPSRPGFDKILTREALEFCAGLERRFRDQRNFLLLLRQETDDRLRRGLRPVFLPETRPVRDSEWTIDAVPDDLQDRRVEITGPPDRKMIIHALNSGANVFMADFEDACSPTWTNIVGGQMHLHDAVRGDIDHVDPTNGKVYRLAEHTATLVVRPRGWHLEEKHVLVDGVPVSAAIFDFGLYFWHNARELLERGSGPYFYLPKLESHLEARLWNSIFCAAQDELGIERGTIKATVLVETILAAFEMDEILYQLREHSAGLNCGRWDYIFSFIKKFQHDPAFVLPDRGQVTMEQRFLAAASELLIRTCHRRGAHAIGGMAAQIPVRDDPAGNAAALEVVRADKRREARAGYDGTWVAHPGLVGLAHEEFDAVMRTPNQIDRRRDDVTITAEDLLAVPRGTKTMRGLRQNIRVGIRYLEAWLRGAGCVPIQGLMEDTATAEICRAQVWQWRRHRVSLDTGETVDDALVQEVVRDELLRVAAEAAGSGHAVGRFAPAADLLASLVLSGELEDFLTLEAYPQLVTHAETEETC